MQAICSLVADINHGAEPDVLLKAQAGVTSLGDRCMARPLGNVLRSEHSLQGGKLADTAVKGRWLVSDRSLPGHTVNLVPIQAVVEHPEAAAERGLSIAKDVQGKSDARRHQDRRISICFI